MNSNETKINKVIEFSMNYYKSHLRKMKTVNNLM